MRLAHPLCKHDSRHILTRATIYSLWHVCGSCSVWAPPCAQADALLRSVVADVSAQPGAAAGVAKLLALMDAGGESQQAVMGSLQELLDGKTEGPGLRALATQLGMQPDGLATAARVMTGPPAQENVEPRLAVS